MAKFIFANTASARLASGVNTTENALVLTVGQGALFPSPGPGELFSLVMRKPSGEIEIMHCWDRDGDTLSVLRGREGTTAMEWSATDWVSNRTTAYALNAWASGLEGALAINENHIFSTTGDRDTYFTENPGELVDKIYIAVGGGFQVRMDGAWVDVTGIMRGPEGPVADIAMATYEKEALAYDPGSIFYDFPRVAVGSDGMLYRCMGTDVTALDIGAAWTASGSGEGEYYYTGANIPAEKPDRVGFGGELAAYGIAGSLAVGEWGWGDNDLIGSDTFYVRLSDGADPDTKDAGYIKYRDDVDPTSEQEPV